MKRKRTAFSVPGLSLLVLIFLSLCLITFSLLSLSESSADEKLSQKAADRTMTYYAASNTANEWLEKIDAQLAVYLKQSVSAVSPESEWLESCSALIDLIPGSTFTNNQFCFSVPVTEDQILQVCLELNYPQSPADSMYQITVWKIVNTEDWQPDRTQKLLTKENFYE